MNKERETLQPRLVLATGIAATGKSAAIHELAKLVPNSIVLDKDALNQALLYVPVRGFIDLPDVESYVASLASSGDLPQIQTPLGQMYRMPFSSDYYHRHANLQTYMVMAKISEINIALGKIPLLDCMPVSRIKDGTVGKFLRQSAFGDIPRYLIHFVCEPKICFDRMVERVTRDPEASIRDRTKIASYEEFLTFITEKQPMRPVELSNYRHLLIDTSYPSPEEIASQCLEYIASDNNGEFGPNCF